MKALKLLFALGIAFLAISPVFASAYIYTRGDYSPYQGRSYNHYYGSYNNYNHYNSYNPHYSNSFYTRGYMPYHGTYGYRYGGDPHWKYAALNYFERTSPRR